MDLLGGILARGCPLWRSLWKKLAEIAKTRTWKPKYWQRNMNFSLSFCSKKTPDTSKHAYGSAEQTFTPLVKRSRQPRKSYRLSKPKILKKGQNLGQKSIFWSTKTQNFRKRQQELVLISAIWGRMQNLRRIVGSVFEIVKKSAEIAEYEFGHTGQWGPSPWHRNNDGKDSEKGSGPPRENDSVA